MESWSSSKDPACTDKEVVRCGNPPKRARLLNDCIIHCSDDSTELIKPANLESWVHLQNAAKIRDHSPLIEISCTTKKDEIPDIKYHRKCRSLFTMKRELELIQIKQMHTCGDEISLDPRCLTSRGATSSSTIYQAVCLFCEQKSKYIKSKNTREDLIKCVDLRSDETVRRVAIEKCDKKIIAASSRELVAAEAHYHRSCYRNFTRTRAPVVSTRDEEEARYVSVETGAYDKLFQFIRSEVILNKRIAKLTFLGDLLVIYMQETNIKTIKQSTKKHIRRKLESEFEGVLHFVPDENGKILVYPDNLTRNQLVVANQKLQSDLQMARDRSGDYDTIINSTALHLRNCIQEQHSKMPWPPQAADMGEVSSLIPTPVKTFIEIILTGEVHKSDEYKSQRVGRLVESYGQDLIHGVSAGRQKTPKHTLLPMAVKSLTGNVRLLNRFGHGLSYSQCEELDTALCLNKLASVEEGTVPLPQKIHPHVLTTLAWDNIDRLEEALSGGGTSHRVNGIAVQPNVYGPFVEPTRSQVQLHKKNEVLKQ